MPASRPVRPTTALLALAASLFTLSACTTDDVVAPEAPAAGVFTVDATPRWVYVNLEDSAVVSPTPSAPESSAWDIAFFSTNVTLNGGAAGPGGVTGYCVCQNTATSPTNAQWLAQTADGEKADFDAVTSVPAGAGFTGDALTPAVTGWYDVAGATGVARPDSFYFVRLSDSSGVAKVRVTQLQTPTGTAAGRVTLEWALAANGAATFGATQTATFDVAAGAKNVDLTTGAATTVAADWDVRLTAWNILVNGGVSGPGKGAAAKITTATFAAALPNATAANAFRTDTYAGVFRTTPFYKYNLAGDNRITPTFDVYLLKKGTAVYKIQIIDYYNATGAARHITFRYERIAG